MIAAGRRFGFEAEFWYWNFDAEDDYFEPADLAPWRDRRRVADLVEEWLNVTKVRAPRDPRDDLDLADDPPQRRWVVEAEYDLDPLHVPDGIGGGVEVISPPLPFAEFAAKIEALCKLVAVSGYTDQNCGVHLNVSVPGIERLDPLKLALLLPEARLLRCFGRLDHGKMRRLRRELVVIAAATPDYRTGGAPPEIAAALARLLPLGKRYALNLQRWREGWRYVEFRHAGGKRWEGKVSQILKAAAQHADLLAVCCTPEAERRRYRSTLLQIDAEIAALRLQTDALRLTLDSKTRIKGLFPHRSILADGRPAGEVSILCNDPPNLLITRGDGFTGCDDATAWAEVPYRFAALSSSPPDRI